MIGLLAAVAMAAAGGGDAPQARAVSCETRTCWSRVRAKRRAKWAARHPKRYANSTCYTLTGRMANGQYVYNGAVAMNNLPLGAVVSVKPNPHKGNRWKRYRVADRIGHGSQLDFGMPGAHGACARWGRRTVSYRVISR